jgi:hypothetical protein
MTAARRFLNIANLASTKKNAYRVKIVVLSVLNAILITKRHQNLKKLISLYAQKCHQINKKHFLADFKPNLR